MSKWIALAAGMLVLAWALWWYDRRARDTPSTASGAADDMGGPATRGDKPDGPLPEAAEPAGEPSHRPQPAHAAPARAVPPPMPASGHFEAMQRAFAAEARDERWAREQEARIPQLIAQAGFPDDAFDRNVTCRRTLCQLQLRVSEGDMFALMKLAAQTQTSRGLGLAYGAADVVDGKTRIVVYLPREGTSREDLIEK